MPVFADRSSLARSSRLGRRPRTPWSGTASCSSIVMSPPNYRRAKRAHRQLWYNGPVRAARMVCDVAGRAVAAAVSLSSSLEPPFISVGQALSATRAGKALYRCSREALSARIRATGRRHRRVDVLGTQISLDVTEREGHEPYFLGVPYESALTALVCSAASVGTFIDIGAHTGTSPSCTPCGQRGGSSCSSPTLASART